MRSGAVVVWLPDGPVPGVCRGKDTGRDDGGGASRGITGDEGVDGRGAGEGEVEVVPLRPASIAGTGVAIAT